MAGRGRAATLPSWMTNNNLDTGIDSSQLISNPPSDYPNHQSYPSDSVGKDYTSTKPHIETNKEIYEHKPKRSRSRSRDRRRSHTPSKDSKTEWKPRTQRQSNFDIRPPEGMIVPPVGLSANLSPNDPYVLQIMQRYMKSSSGKSSESNSLYMQQTKHARRLYIGGVTPETTENELGNFIESLIVKSMECSWDDLKDPIIETYINRDKCFAFLEMKNIEITSACLHFDGTKFTNGRGIVTTLRIRRPNDFKPDQVPTNLRPQPTVNLSKLGLVSASVSDGPEKVFVGGLPYNLTDDNVKELLTVFGTLKSFHLVRDAGSVTSKGYGFCEYHDTAAALAAISGLNGMAIGEKTLTVRYASQTTGIGGLPMGMGMPPPPPPMAAYPPPTGGMFPPPSMLPTGYAAPYTSNIPTTRILKLGNLVSPEELMDNQEYFDIQEDVRGECSPYGRVLNVVIPRTQEGFPLQSVGNIYVEFANTEAAISAANALSGRKFADRLVSVEFYDEQKYSMGQL